MDENIIQSAKLFAQSQHISVSELVENYFGKMTNDAVTGAPKVTGVIGELAGLLNDVDLDSEKNAHIDYLEKNTSEKGKNLSRHRCYS